MNGHFEKNRSTYPIGYLRAGSQQKDGESLYRVSDMRSLEPLHSQPIPLKQAEVVADGMNVLLREQRITEKADIEENCERLIQAVQGLTWIS